MRRDREELRTKDAALFVHPGMLALKRATGREHPFIRALEWNGRCTTVLDATLGMAGDALHAAAELEVQIRGIEGSAAVHSLLEEGLPRMAAVADVPGLAASRIRAEHGTALEVLGSLPNASTDVVLIDPMFDTPRPSAPGFELIRRVAYEADDPAALLAQACRVASSHVVFKYPKRATYPPCDACVDGKAVRYLIYRAR
ncbi:MAG: class I SAM-dependent methyltransferase [Nannocystaceae bacterium]|nr:class I SAM-dependent methyltransferase [Nannocystaceae bacterium]